jgi:hypothetical protein
MRNNTWEAYREAVAVFYGIRDIDQNYTINVAQYKVEKMSDIKSFSGKIQEG